MRESGLRQLARAAAVVLLCSFASAQADEVRVGRYRIVLPDGVTAAGRDFDAGRTGGDSGLPIHGRLLRISTAGGEPLAMLALRTVSGAGLFQWASSCKNVKTDASTFVHSPFDYLVDECLIVAGPFDLDGSLRNMVPAGGRVMDEAGWRLRSAGYVVTATLAVESGEMLDIVALVPLPFDGLPVPPARPENRSRVPDRVVAWGLALAEQVKAGVGSLSGKWLLPAIVRPHDGKTRVALMEYPQ